MTLESLLALLDHIDSSKGWTRRRELLLLVGIAQGGSANPAPLGRRFLVASGRTERQARYDHALLVALAREHRCLRRWRGGGSEPDCWALADVARWRGVPWIGSRLAVVRAFSAPLPDAAVAGWAKSPGQHGPIGPETGLEGDTDEAGQAEISGPSRHAIGPSRHGEGASSAGALVHPATEGSPSSPCLSSSPSEKNSSSSFEEEEEGDQSQGTPAGYVSATAAAIGRVIAERIGKARLFGAALSPVAEIVARYPDRSRELVELAVSAPGISDLRSPVQAALTFAELANAQAAAGWPKPPPDPRIAGIERQIATREALGIDEEDIADLRAELARLQNPEADTPDP